MEYKFYQYPRGVNKGGVLDTDICPTISCSSWENNCFLIEIDDMEEIHPVFNSHTLNEILPFSVTTRISSNNQQILKEMNNDSIVEPLNPYKDGTCRTIKAQYQQSSRANFARQDGLGATGVVQIGNIYPDTDNFKNRVAGRIYSAEGLSPTLRTVTGWHNEPKVVEQKPRYRIRKLTPRECFRLMDVNDTDIDKIQAAGISNSQQYKMAGNSIVVACLYGIFEQLFYPRYTNSGTLF